MSDPDLLDTSPSPSPSPTSARSVVRDVSINVLANLIAAAIIYLGAVAGGYLSANRLFVALAVLLLVTAVAFSALRYAHQRAVERPGRARLDMALGVARLALLVVPVLLVLVYVFST